ncbi:MAG: DUF1295 domain-containing protein [Burkholderiaceae bacterium]
MIDFDTLWPAAATGLGVSTALAFVVWTMSVAQRDVSIVDVFWSAFIWLPPAIVTWLDAPGPRALPVLALLGIWALRLSVHIGWRSRGQPEDHRYQEIRKRNEPGFAFKSLYLVFGLQALLGWLVATAPMAAVVSTAGWHPLDALGLALMVFGIGFETIADAQLSRFKSNPANRGQVMDRGLWRYSRHPNYFGECCLWWGVWLMACAAGAWWALISPVIMTIMLLRISGVKLLEKDIVERRPGYADYVRRTNAFIPGRPAG